ncbi:hypothetical protein DFS34DRAFT_593712 [Phlyctochytrium arcticum]|nr:hypothetical protein DFS34DRAFT_593712 [Phlyctochytrium arcticum]
MIRRTKIKKEYYKMLKREGVEHVKAVDMSGDESENDHMDEARNQGDEQPDADNDSEQEIVIDDNGEPYTSDEEDDESEAETSRDNSRSTKSSTKSPSKSKSKSKSNSKPSKPHKPNPFAKSLAIAAQQKKEREESIAEAKRLREERDAGRKAYYTQRNNTRSKLQQRTRKGQPVMANQLSHLLAKIQSGK